MPKWGMTMTEGTVADWLFEEGDEVNIGSDLVEIETEKISSAIEAPAQGILKRIIVKKGSAKVASLIAVISQPNVSEKEIDEWVSRYHKDIKPTVVIKSTVPPGTTDRLHKKYKGVDVIFNPEFLTEMNFIEDFKNQSRIILGGIRRGTSLLRQVYSKVFPHATIVKTNAMYAEMVKYFINSIFIMSDYCK